MKSIKNIVLWILVALIFILACTTNIVGIIFGLIAIALIIPIKKWQDILSKFIKKPIKIIAIVLAIILMFISMSSISNGSNANTSSGTATSNVQVDTNNSNDQNQTNESSNTSSIESDTFKENETSSESADSPKDNATNNSSVAEHTHTFAAATCVLPEKCSCGETKGTAKGHSWKEATCITAKTCTVCGANEGSSLGHNFSGGSCTVCGATDSNYTPPATNTTTYVLNTESKKFHTTSCGWLPKENREDTTKSREELVEEGYTPCGHCDP